MNFTRSGLIVMPPIWMSHLPAFSADPVFIVSNGVSTIFWVTPSRLATRSMSSTSKPTTLPDFLSSDWKGG